MHGNATHPTGRSEPFTNLEWFLLTVSLFGMVFNIALGWIGILLFLLPWMVYAACWPRRVIADMSSTLLPWLLPLLALTSALWSWDPDRSLRSGLQMMVTVGIAIVAARRLTVQQIASSLMLVQLLGQIASLISGRQELDGISNEMAFVGIFGSKNNQSLNVGMLLIAAAAVLSDRTQPKLFRMLALLAIGIGAIALVKARSVGGMAGAMGAMMLFFGVLSLQLFGMFRYMIVSAICGVVLLAALAFLTGVVTPGMVLEQLGKSSTLTGRTTLWAYGLYYIQEHPLGSGFQAFWRQGFVEAEGLWTLMRIKARAGFHFHNLYINAGVELGILGIVVVTLLLWGSWLRSVGRAITVPSPATAFLAAFLTYFLFRSFLEVDAYGAFALPLIILVVGWVARPPRTAGVPAAAPALRMPLRGPTVMARPLQGRRA